MTNTRRRRIIGAVFALIAGGLYFAGHGQAQTSGGGGYASQFQQAAQNLLNSPASQALSGAGLTAVKVLAGAVNRTAPAVPSIAIAQDALAVTPSANVLVNNPALDPFSFVDISTQSETAVAGFGGNILVAYNNSSGLFFPNNSVMSWSRSTDGGNSFTQVGFLPVTPTGFNGGDPGLVVNRSGVFYASAIAYDFTFPPANQGGVGIWKSTDGGLTFTGPVYTPAPPATFPGDIGIGDKPFIAVDTSGKQYDGNVYVTWTAFGQTTGGIPIVFSRSTDGGNTFSTPIQVTPSGGFGLTQGSAPAVGPNGEVYVAWFQAGCNGISSIPFIYVAKSVDGGQTFGLPVPVAPLQALGFGAGYSCFTIGGTLTGNFRVNSFPRIDVNPKNGHVYIVFGSHSVPSADSGDAFFTESTDGGQTWSIPLKVNDDRTSNDQFFPAVAVNGQGVIQVIWYDRRRDPNNLLIDVYSATSTNDGASFHSNQRVTTVSSPPAVGFDPLINPTYMGDYIDVKAMTGPSGRGSQFLQAWGDTRRVVETFGGVRHDQDVRFSIDAPTTGSSGGSGSGGGSGHD